MSEEVSTFDYGHYNAWPLTVDASNPVNHGALDWGNGTDKSLLIDDIIDGTRAMGATTFQINHPNGNVSTFGGIQLDADTLKTHADPARLRLPTPAGATADDTGLFPKHKWDAMEVMNGFSRSSYDGLLNNWMTFMSNGLVVTATAVSDSHKRWSSAGGYPRSYVHMNAGHDTLATWDVADMSAQVNAHHVVGSVGLFVKAYAFKTGTAYRLDHLDEDCASAGAACAQVGDTLSVGDDGLDVVVDVQSPEWIPFDEVDLFDHRASRWMTNGVPDTDFAPEKPPPAGAQTAAVTPALEPAVTADATHDLGCGQATCTANRWHAQQVFHLDAASGQVPAGDDFFVVVARNSNASQDLMPMVYDGVSTSSGQITEKPAHAFAFTNPLFIDRDGSGAYDHFPHLQDAAGTRSRPRSRPLPTGSLEDRARAMFHAIYIER